MEWLTELIRSFTGLLKWWIIIAPWEQGIRVRLGKEAALLRPGPHFRVPLLDRTYVVATRLRMTQGRSQTATTLDGHVVTVGCAIQYAVHDARRLFEVITNPEATLKARVRAAIAETVGEVDRKDLSRSRVQQAAEASIQGEEWGLERVSVRVVDMAFVKTFRLMQAHEHEEHGALDSMIQNMERKI